MGMQMETVKSEEDLSSINVFLWSDIHKRRKIGKGGHGQIFEAELRPEGRTVAIKEVNPSSDFEDKNATFCYEARMMARLQHPNLIQFHGVAADLTDIANATGLSNLVMEFMPTDLHTAMFREDGFVLLPWRSRVIIALQIAQDIEYMHSKGIIHFDIKPANVLLDLTDPSQPLCKICDFGVATDKETDQTLMQGGYGTPGRIAPEMVNDHRINEKITEKADAYSFGVLLSELLSGKMHRFFSDFVYRNDHVKGIFFSDGEHHNTVPEWCFQQWRRLMRDCLTCKASTRPDFTEVAARLRDMLAALDSEAMDDVNTIEAFAISDDEDSFWKGYFDDENLIEDSDDNHGEDGDGEDSNGDDDEEDEDDNGDDEEEEDENDGDEEEENEEDDNGDNEEEEDEDDYGEEDDSSPEEELLNHESSMQQRGIKVDSECFLVAGEFPLH